MPTFRLKSDGMRPAPSMLHLPWDTPLEQWPDDAAVARGEHRHVVRFGQVEGEQFAFKELSADLAEREYRLLESLKSLGLPVVTLIGTVTDRRDEAGGELDAILITRVLSFSLPYRSLFAGSQAESFRDRLVSALVVLLVRIHLAGFFWGDCSLNNALFRSDAGTLRAYVVDTETGELHAELSTGQRLHDLGIAVENLVGGLLDLQAAGQVPPTLDAVGIADQLSSRYHELWDELTGVDQVARHELWRVQARIERINRLGFEASEFEMNTTSGGHLRLRPTVLTEGHHRRKMAEMLGIHVHENQARRLLSDINSYRAWSSRDQAVEVAEAVAAYHWLTERWLPTVSALPEEAKGNIEPAEFFHEVLDHCWYLSERAGHDIGLAAATADYIDNVLGAGITHGSVDHL